jgi:hypothetical protein
MTSWYSARLLFESSVEGDESDAPLCEESIRVLRAESSDAALLKAADIGHAAEHEYPNDSGKLVKWSFVSVLEVQDLCEDELREGTEVFSRLFRRDTAEIAN